MGRPEDAVADNEDLFSAEDDLGHLIRWGLEGSLSNAEPSAGVWIRVLERVRELEVAPAPKRALKRLLPQVPLAQAVLVSAMLLAFGLGVDRELVTSRSYPPRARPTVRGGQAQVESSDDMLRGYMLFRRPLEPLAQKARRLAEVNQLR